jgi:hypothetical protein
MQQSITEKGALECTEANQTQITSMEALLVLAPPRSFSSVVAAMLGQHPQMYGMPELQLFGAETMAEWWALCAKATFPMTHGLLRAS